MNCGHECPRSLLSHGSFPVERHLIAFGFCPRSFLTTRYFRHEDSISLSCENELSLTLMKKSSFLQLLVMAFLTHVVVAVDEPKPPPAGTWYCDNSKSVMVLFPDGRMLFTSLIPYEQPVGNWHIVGSWKKLPADKIQLIFPPYPDEKNGKTRRYRVSFYEGMMVYMDGRFFHRLK